MAFFALLWKARTIEKYRINYEKEKINSIVLGQTRMEQTLSQRWRHYSNDTKKRISRTFKRWYPEGSGVANFFIYMKTDQTFANFLFKSVMGFVGGIILTYLCFMFFVFQLSISLMHATIMSSIIGVLLTLGLAFSYRIRCLVFLLIPQFFSRVGRYTLTCYALVLILTGPATNTLKNSEVLSESMACSQEHIKTSVHQLNDLMKKPFNALKDSIKLMIDRLKMITAKVKETVIRIDRLVMSIVSVIQSSFSWLQSVTDICNDNLGTPFERCQTAMKDGVSDCEKTLGPDLSGMCNVVYVAQAACYSVQPFHAFCFASDFMDEAILANVKKKIRNFSEHLRAMFHVEVHIHHAYSFSSNTSRSASQVAAGIVTEIRNRADPLLTWLSWSSCVTSLFLLLIIFRAKYYQHMYETRSRFDNRYVTKELQELDLKRQRQGRETVLPLNRRERAKYITTTSFRLVASEKVYLNRSAVFMAITTFKLLIHMVADYSLYWVLMTIRYHGRYQSDLMPGIPHSGVHVSGKGFVARLFRSIVSILDIPLASPAPSAISCLPDPYPPDLRRYTQIGVLIFLLWFFALFEPYGLRLRHLIMGHYRPERAKARATWLYNHILRTRAGFMKFARRKLHRDYKYSSESALTFRQWITDRIPFQCCRSLLGFGPKELHCLLCGTTSSSKDPDSKLTRCQTPGCPGTFCISCFTDIGELCTICLSPADYGDLSDVSLEKGSSDDSDSDGEWAGKVMPTEYMIQLKNIPFQWREAPKYEFCNRSDISCNRRPSDRCMKLFGPISRLVPEKVYAKRALERFRNKVNTIDTLPSSLVQKMMSTINAVRDKSPPKYDSPICLSKRASFYRAFNKDLIQGSDIIDTDMLFKNENYFDDRIDVSRSASTVTIVTKDAFDTTGNSKFTISNPLVGKELIISRSSDEKTSKPRVTRRCKCDLYEDLQRKWTHVKKSLSDKGSMISKKLHLKNPLSMMKNFCSSLFGPSCTTDTCPNKRDKESKAKRDKDSKKTKSKKDKKGQIGTQTNERKPKGRMGQASIQTQSQKNTETQLASDVDIEKQIEIEEEIYLEREKEKQRIKEQEKEKERNRMEIEKLQMERERQENEKEKIGKDIQEKAETKDKCAEEQIKLEKCKEEQRRTEAYNSGDTDKTGSKDSKKKGMSDRQNTTKDREMMNKGIYATPEMATGACQAIDCPNYCHRSVQYDKRDAKQAKNMKSKGVGSVKCVCDEAVQGSKQKTLCTCATQHVSDQKKAGTPKASPVMVRSFTLNQDSPVDGKNMQQKRGRHNDISKREPQKLSLENEICMLDRSAKLAKAMQDVLSDSLTNNSSLSSLCSEVEQSARSDETRTDTTICSLATFDDQPRRRKFRVKVITKTNQATLTDKTRLCDTGTITNDWWSPIVERKARDEILLEKKKGFNAIEQQKKQLKELKEWKELREVRKRRRNCGVTTDGRIVTFRSRTQIIPTGLFPGPNDIMSPSRYLLESQKYYNELFSYNFRPPQVDYTCLTAQSHPKYQEKEKTRSPLGSRRNHHRKTKRLDECYSPRRQLPPRKRHTESIKTSDSPRRKSYAHRHTSTRHHTKYLSPRKRY